MIASSAGKTLAAHLKPGPQSFFRGRPEGGSRCGPGGGAGRFIAFLFCLLAVSLLSGPAKGVDANQAPPARARCPVCGMFVAKYSDWLTVMKLHDGTMRYFDGTKDMFKFYLAPSGFESAIDQADIASLFVREYYELKLIEAKTAYFVTGSDVLGPMGHELIPFGTEQDALEFKKDHKGKKILRFHEVTPEVLKALDPF